MKRKLLLILSLVLISVTMFSLCACDKAPQTDEPSTEQPRTTVSTSDGMEQTNEPSEEDTELQKVTDLFEEAANTFIRYTLFDIVDVMPYSDDVILGQTKEIDGISYIDTGIEYESVYSYLGDEFSGQMLENIMNRYFYNENGMTYAVQTDKNYGRIFTIANISIEKAGERDEGTDYIASYDLVINFETIPLKSMFTVAKESEDAVTKITYIDFLAESDVAAVAYESAGYTSLPTNEELTSLFERCEDVTMTYFYVGADYGFLNDFPEAGDYNSLPKTEINGTSYLVTDLDYQAAVDKYSEIFTGERLEKFLDTFFYNADGKLYLALIGGASGAGYSDPSFVYLGQNGNDFYYLNFAKLMLTADDYVEYHPATLFMIVTKEDDGIKISNADWIWPSDFDE